MAGAEKAGIHIQYIQPGMSQQNTYIERYNRTVGHEWLGQNIFETIKEAQEQATEWLWTYNNDRPNMAIGGITPAMKTETSRVILQADLIKNGGITTSMGVLIGCKSIAL